MDDNSLRRFQDKSLRSIVNYSYSVPLYRDKYKKAGVHPGDIKGVGDIEKLPVVSKEDFKKYYPDGIISSKTSKNRLIEISTSGTTGKSLSLFGDRFDAIFWFLIYIRILREHGINWRKDRISVIGDFAPHTIGTAYVNKGLLPNIGGSFLDNIQFLNTNDEPSKVFKELVGFKPDFIGGYPGMLGHLALLLEKGNCDSINPRVIATIGSVLDTYLKNYISGVFSAPVFEVYGATESGTIAFQCKKGCFHVISDLVLLEFFRDGKSVVSDIPVKMVVTKLYGSGTPVIRYDAINDIVSPFHGKCGCGLPGSLIGKVYGRDDLSLLLRDGSVLLASSISGIYSRLLYELKTTKVKETRVVQHSFDNIEVQVVIDEKTRGEPPLVDEVFSVIKNGFERKVGSDVEINVHEVKKIDSKGPRIVTLVDNKYFKIKNYV